MARRVRHSQRLQDKTWYRYRREHHLTLKNIYKSSHGNYRADMVDEHGKKFHHWLNPMEAQKLENSGYLKDHPAEDSNKLFKEALNNATTKNETL